MDFSMILDWVVNQGIWCALFVWLFYQNKKEAAERENKLTQVVEEQVEKLGEISNTLSIISERLDDVEAEFNIENSEK